MNPTILTSDEIDKEKWDDFILQSREGNIYATYTYLQGCEREWKATILYDKENNHRAVMPFQVRKVYGMTYIYQDPFARELGIFSKDILSKVEYAALLNTTFKSCRYVAKYHFNVDNYKLFRNDKFYREEGLTEAITFHLDLRQTYGEIWEEFNKNRKRDIKKAEKYRLEVVCSKNMDEAFELFKANTIHKIKGLMYYQLELEKALYTQLIDGNVLKVYYVSLQGQKIAAGLYIKFKQKITYIFGTNSDLAKKTGASTCLHNHMIKEYAGQNLTFDFEGFEGGEVSSLGSFYESFGAEKKIIYVHQKNELPWPIKKLMQIRRALA